MNSYRMLLLTLALSLAIPLACFPSENAKDDSQEESEAVADEPAAPAPSKEPVPEPREEEPGRHYEDDEFSYVIPDGWETQEWPGAKYKIVMGPEENGLTPSLNIVDEAYTGSLEDYADLNIEQAEMHMLDFELFSRTDFETDHGDTAIRFDTVNTQQGQLFRMWFYLFDGETRNYVLTCTAHTEAHDLDAMKTICDDAARTFRVE